jgi:hypothetical protein
MNHLPLAHLALSPDHYGHSETYRTRDYSLNAELRHASRARRDSRRGFPILRVLTARLLQNERQR